MFGQGIYLRADVRRDEGADGPLPLQRMQIHEDEHASKSARLYGQAGSANRIAVGSDRACAPSDRANARNLGEKVGWMVGRSWRISTLPLECARRGRHGSGRGCIVVLVE